MERLSGVVVRRLVAMRALDRINQENRAVEFERKASRRDP